jgi:hypothetical protein
MHANIQRSAAVRSANNFAGIGLSVEAPPAGARSVGMTTVPHILANHVRRRRWRADIYA